MLIKLYYSTVKIGCFITIVVFLVGCNKELMYDYQPTDLRDFVMYKEVSNDTIILVSQGGPTSRLVSKESISDLLRFFPYNVAFVHQTQTKDSLLLAHYYITEEEAKKINDLSSAILDRTINHFKAQGKYVIVFGGSFGSFLGLRTLDLYGVNADCYALVIGRLDMDQEYVTVYKEHKYGSFFEGTTIEKTKYIDEKNNWAAASLMADIGQPRYSERLKGKNLSRLIFLHRFKDNRVGALKAAEIAFLENHKATVVGQPGDHTFDESDYKYIINFVRKK